MKKKIVAVLMFLILAANINSSALAFKAPSCPSKPYDVSNIVFRGLQGAPGINLLVSQIVESQVKSQIKQMADGDFYVKARLYSVGDLLFGKLKNIEIQGKNISAQDIHLSSIEARTLCEFIDVDYMKNPVVFKTPINLEFKGLITKDDLGKTIKSPQYQEKLSKIKLSSTDITLLNIYDPKVDIENDKLVYGGRINFGIFPESMATPFEMKAKLGVNNGKIKLSDTDVKISKLGIKIPGKLFDFVNPVLSGLTKFEDKGTQVAIKDITISNNKIDFSGNVYILPTKK